MARAGVGGAARGPGAGTREPRVGPGTAGALSGYRDRAKRKLAQNDRAPGEQLGEALGGLNENPC